jgi:TRAP-type C4-dicarboxylate transport system permease small subunit
VLRAGLDGLYRMSGWLAAACLLALALVVLAQIGGRLIGVMVPSATQIAGFLLAATIFLALAYTLAEGEHIRVMVVLEHLGPRARFWLELWIALASLGMTAFLSVYAVQLAYESWLFGDRADGLLPIPLVLPQSTMALGAIVLVVRFLDEVVTLLQTGAPIHLLSHEEAALRDLVGGETSPRDA